MNRTKKIAAAAAMTTAIMMGAAAPAATAADAPAAPATVTTTEQEPLLGSALARQVLATPELANQLNAEERAGMQAIADQDGHTRETRSVGGNAAKAAWELIKKAGPGVVNAAKKAAAKGASGLKDWAKGLSWKSPIRWTVGQLPAWALEELIKYILS
ncbi:hypothetical protein ACFQ6N_39200 [Kitasatospora sp. NPDC056446]|uniref:hypothetical protein n=1 Tax=Kitasatospora sp. NPDC056446 TaxID=3345819 RepID=UPI0036C791BC